ncbi:MAG: hypothetical protein DRM99_05350, partial [Thermoplasmata archaeon]
EKLYPIYTSLTKEEVASIFTSDPKELIGRVIKINLSNLARGKLGEVTCKIKEIKEEKILAEPSKIKLYPSYIKRFIRRGITKIDESFLIETSEKNKVRVKPTIITRKKVKGGVETALRKELKLFLTKLFAAQKTDEIFLDTIKGEIQKKLSKKLKRIYPLSFCEIREILIVGKK